MVMAREVIAQINHERIAHGITCGGREIYFRLRTYYMTRPGQQERISMFDILKIYSRLDLKKRYSAFEEYELLRVYWHRFTSVKDLTSPSAWEVDMTSMGETDEKSIHRDGIQQITDHIIKQLTGFRCIKKTVDKYTDKKHIVPKEEKGTLKWVDKEVETKLTQLM